jgi:hypothetical protein
MLPRERALVRKLADKPFTLLGINSDKSRSALQKVLREQKITWPNIHDGSGSAARIASEWNVTAWPTIYVLDHAGVIWYREVSDDDLEQAVTELLKEVPRR